MHLPISWLRDWIEIDERPERIAEALTMRGFYVEDVHTHGHAYPGIVVARITDVAKHPNADKLSLCRVDAGAGEVAVVCGAPNVRPGMIAPLATVGASLPGGLTIKKSKIRGEVSEGMLCSARELEISDDHEGIVDLERFLDGRAVAFVPGEPLASLLPPPEVVLEIEIPFNRPDGLGIIGLAREVKAAFGGSWTREATTRLADAWQGKGAFDVKLEDPEGCPFYIAQAVEGVKVAPSPAWLARRLESIGQRPISNIVDITNYVLFEYGQPLHAFDLDRLQGPAIRVRRAAKGESLITLDGKERALDAEMLLIADRERPVAVAGVMGGADSEVTAKTTRLLLECAWFDPRRVRRGARLLGLTTEASKRFERGVDPAIGPAATRRFLALLTEACPEARLAGGDAAGRAPVGAAAITLRASRCRRLIGADVPAGEMRAHLEALEFGVAGKDPLAVTVPTWRRDVTLEDDLIEEVARSYGYDRIPEAPLETHGVHAVRTARERMIERARAAMVARGFAEAWTTSLVSEREAIESATLLGQNPEALVRLVNPMSREHELLRPNPVAGLMRAVAHNLRQGVPAVRLFEVGAGFESNGEGLPAEPLMLAAAMVGPRYAHAHDAAQGNADDADARGIWEAWLEEMRVDRPIWRAYAAVGWKPGASAEVATRTSRIGWAGTLGQSLLRAWDIEVPVHLFVARLDPLDAQTTDRPALRLPGRYPPVRRDLAFFVPSRVTHREIEETLAGAAGETLHAIELFDVYSGPGTPEGMRSLAYALQFQDPDRTLEEAEVQIIQDRMVAAVAKQLGGQLRER